MKKRIALLLAIVMLVTILPMSVFASSSQSVSAVLTLGDSKKVLGTGTNMTYDFEAPTLNIKLTDGLRNSAKDTFRLTLSEAEWLDITKSDYHGYFEGGTCTVLFASGGKDWDGTREFNVTRINASTMEFEPAWTGADLQVDSKIGIYLESKTTGKGNATVTIDGRDSRLSSGVVTTYVRVQGSSTTLSIVDTTDLEDKANQIKNVTIDENVIGTFKFDEGYELELRLPSTWNFVDKGGPTIQISGGLRGVVEEDDWDFDYDDNVLTCTIKDSAAITMPAAGDIEARSTLTISGLWIKPTSSAKYGDVKLSIGNNDIKASKESVLVGTYKDYGVTFTADDEELPVIIAGKYPGSADSSDAEDQDDIETLTVTLEETIPNSWWKERKTEFIMPDGIKIRAAEITLDGTAIDSEVDGATLRAEGTINRSTSPSWALAGLPEETVIEISESAKSSKLVMSGIESVSDDTASAEITFWISAEAGFEGDVAVKVKGAAVDADLEAVIAKVVKPIEVETKRTIIKIGFKNIETQNITLKENVAGALSDEFNDSDAIVALWIGEESEGDDHDLRFSKVGSVEVIAGDLEIDDFEIEGGELHITVDNMSTEPSTVEIKGLHMNVDRTPPEGFWSLSIGGDGFVQNYSDDAAKSNFPGGYFKTSSYVLPEAYQVVTSAPGSESTWSQEAVMTFQDGVCNAIVVGDKIVNLDPAAFISEENRTMLPLRYVAIALNISENNISWFAPEKRATVTHNGKTVSVVIGSSALYEYGVAVTDMGSPAVIVEERTFIPLAAVARALGVSYLWDQETRTVVFNPSAASIAKYPNAVTVQGNTSDNAVVTSTSITATDSAAAPVVSTDAPAEETEE